MNNYNQNLTVTEDRHLRVENVSPGTYKVMLIPINPDSKGWRGFYRGTVLPFVNHAKIEDLGGSETEEQTHEYLKEVANGGRSTSRMSTADWKKYMVRIESHCIQVLQIGWAF